MTSSASSVRVNPVVALLGLVALPTALLASDWRLSSNDGPGVAVALYGASIAAIVYFARSVPDALFPADFSPAERRASSGVFFGLLALLVYSRLLWVEVHRADPSPEGRAFVFHGFVFSLALLGFAGTVAHRALGGRQGDGGELDERDRRIAHDAATVANTFLTISMLGVAVLLAMYPDTSGEWLRPSIIAIVLIALVIARTLIEHTIIVARYRRARR